MDYERGWTYAGAAANLAQHATGEMWPTTRDKLEWLASDECPDPRARAIAAEALEKEDRYERTGDDTDED
jgi:hypothetical protein